MSLILALMPVTAVAQVADASNTAPPSISEKWEYFSRETVAPYTLGAGAFNAAVSQLTQTTPQYGRGLWPPYFERLGASVADIVSQNVFGDFVLASALHEDTRYRRKGESSRLLPRIGYAISRSVVTRTDAGRTTFNWANVLGTGMSAGLSNAYYPEVSRTAGATAANWGVTVAASGFANLLPEFLPDFKRWLKRHHL